ncbi:MAG TPA: MFS transporter [Rhodocyclaceae bacterium]|nr:MFS transporter [Rhodocyclaceae bacterium]HNC62989.1 MFS transporter [Rhodocyclaceae bacterium]
MSDHAKMPWRDYGALVAAIAVAGLGLGTALPLSALTLDRWGFGNHVVGALAALTSAGILLVAPFVARWTRRCGARRLLLGAVVVSVASIAVLDASRDLVVWSIARLVFGAAMGVLFTIGEAWINRVLPAAQRGRWLGVYASIFTLCQLAGPLLVKAIDGAALPFVVTGLLFLPALPIIALLREAARDDGLSATAPPRMRSVLPQMQVIVAGTAFFALFDTVALSLLPLFGLRHGLGESVALYATSAVIAGDTVLQPIIGWLSDRYGRARMHAACGAAQVAAALALPFAVHAGWLLWPLLLLLGASAGGIYVLSLVATGERFGGERLIAASAVINVSWGIAGIVGPLLTGAAMEAFGPDALPVALAVCALLFLLVQRLERTRTVAELPT